MGENGEPLVKESIERYILGHAGKGSHDGYGKHSFETLKRAVEVIPNLSLSDRALTSCRFDESLQTRGGSNPFPHFRSLGFLRPSR